MEKIKVLQFPVYNDAGGVPQYVINNWRFIDRSRFQFGFATMEPRLSYEDSIINEGAKVHYINTYAEDGPEAFKAAFGKILDEGYSAVHLHTNYWKSFACEEVAKQKNIPVVIIHSHNTHVGRIRGMSREEAIALHNRQRLALPADYATHFCACSSAAAEWLYGPQIPQSKIRILPNAIDVEKFAYSPAVRAEYRKALGLENSFVIGHVGRFDYQKNHDFLIDAFAGISGRISGAKLMLVGIGAQKEEIEAKVARLGLSDRVMFLGKRGDVAALYQAMDIFALPSRFEGLGIVLIEAQTAGLACLASEAVPIEAKVTDNLSYLPLELNAWREAILSAAQNGCDRRDRSAEVAAAGYSIKEQIKVLERIYAGEE